MPIYNYKCTECGAEKEVICKYEDREDVMYCEHHWRKTPQDERMTMKLILSSSNFVVNGFNYKNGYSNKKEE